MIRDAPKAPILNAHVPNPPWRDPRTARLPGVSPLDPADWIWVLDSYPAQMAERERLLCAAPERVHALTNAAMEAAQEVFDRVLGHLDERSDFSLDADGMRCPDGRVVPLDRSAPLLTLGRLIQEDLCVLIKPDGGTEHVLAGAILCFPANWTLAEKLGRPMLTIHAPVPSYDADLARRVQRLLDGVQPDRPLWRANRLWSDNPVLFQPRREADPRAATQSSGQYFRSERQCLLRLPKTGAVVFSIHTVLLRREDAAL